LPPLGQRAKAHQQAALAATQAMLESATSNGARRIQAVMAQELAACL
jgi:hypothetical protein